jgi:hypothetical protein
MRITESKLRKLIRETISEVVTPDFMYGDDARGYSDPNAFNQDPQFVGFDPEETDYVSQQGLDSSAGSGYGSQLSTQQDDDDGLDPTYSEPQVDVDFILDSQVLRGQPGNVDRTNLSSGDIYSIVAGDQVLSELGKNYQLNSTRDTLSYGAGIINALSSSGIIKSLGEESVSLEDLEFIGVRGRASGKIYTLRDWIESKKSGQIRMDESRRAKK